MYFFFRTNDRTNSEDNKYKNFILKPKDVRLKMANKIDCTPQSENMSKLHTVTRPILIPCRCIGLFPVTGLFSSTPNKLR